MKVEIVTPAGRKKSLQILYKHLASQTQYFNKWTLWINTQNEEDIQYCKFLEKTNNWIKTIDLDNPYQGCLSICTFFKHAEDLDSIYIRLDDDIVWLSENFIKNLSDFRIKNPKYFLVYANIFNNAINDHLQQRFGNLISLGGNIGYGCMCPVGWGNGEIAKLKHEEFLKTLSENDIEKFKFKINWILNNYERHSVNCISWFGSEFAKINKTKDPRTQEEEHYLSVVYPTETNQYNIICGEVLCVHYGFSPQRKVLDTTDVLDRYDFAASNFKKYKYIN